MTPDMVPTEAPGNAGWLEGAIGDILKSGGNAALGNISRNGPMAKAHTGGVTGIEEMPNSMPPTDFSPVVTPPAPPVAGADVLHGGQGLSPTADFLKQYRDSGRQ